MTLSISAQAPTKSGAVKAATEKLDTAIDHQPVYRRSRHAIIAAIHLYADLVVDDPTRDILINVVASLSWEPVVGGGDEPEINLASIHCTVTQADSDD